MELKRDKVQMGSKNCMKRKFNIIVDIPEISNHMWYEENCNIGDVYPDKRG